jgi:hypothetical protein
MEKEKKGYWNWSVNSVLKEGTEELSRHFNTIERHHRAAAQRRDPVISIRDEIFFDRGGQPTV